ncbi:hypothetical protein [Streptomyces sp. NBC_01613]|uniref:family 4 glycosyl hydrolase n=1 Tax=Streptomyces sp. NBC_01613 TaxID=2975896 RepID=UPI003870DAA0
MTAGPASALSSSACRTIYGNAPNHGLIDNLPPDSVVEVPCLTDALGVQPTRVGALPPQCAVLNRAHDPEAVRATVRRAGHDLLGLPH